MNDCDLCGKSFSSETMLKVHKNRDHLGLGVSKERIRENKRKKFSQVAVATTTGEASCPKCHGTSFTAKRSRKGKLKFGILAPKTQVKCVTCGAMFLRE